MKIAVNTRFLLPGKLEGIGWVTYELLRRLVADHPEHEFLFLFDRPFDQQFIFGKNVKGVQVLPPARHPILFYCWFEWAIPRILKQEGADVFLYPVGFFSLRTKVPTLLMVHDVAHVHFPGQVKWSERKYYQYFMPLFLNRAKHILTVSHFSKKDILDHYDLAAEKIEVVYNGCRDHFKPLEQGKIAEIRQRYSEGLPYFFYVGALQPRKNIDRLIQAFDHFKQQTNAPHQLLIGGRFAWKNGPITSAYKSAKHQDDIKFLGYIPDEELPHLMGAAFALTYVSLFEGFGLPVLEALSCGLPVITSATSSLPEVAGKAGLLVDPYSMDEIAGAMERLIKDEQLVTHLKSAGLEQARQFDWDQAAEQVWEVLMKVAG